MHNKLLLAALIIISGGMADAQDRFTADREKTSLQWLGEKVTGQHNGTIKLQEGWLVWQDNKIITGEFIIDMSSIKDAGASKRLEDHLKSDDFFGVEKFPVSKLIISGSDAFDKGTAVVRGSLNIKDVINQIEFRATVQKKDDGTWFYANIIVDRSKYNVRYGSGTFFDNLGDKIIYDEFKLKVSLLVK